MLEKYEDMTREEVEYELYPYKDYNGWNLEVGSMVQFAMDSRTYGKVYKVVQFTRDAQKALIEKGDQKYWVTLSTLRWVL